VEALSWSSAVADTGDVAVGAADTTGDGAGVGTRSDESSAGNGCAA
jgi:hypothetical protein